MKTLACVLIVCAVTAVVLAAPRHGNNPTDEHSNQEREILNAVAVLFGVEIAELIDPEFSRSPCAGSPSDPSEWMADCQSDPWVGGGQDETCLDTCLENCEMMDENCGWTYNWFATCSELCWDRFDG